MISDLLRPLALPILFVNLLMLSACSTVYYGTMEKVGIHKRDILVDRVEAARDAQHEGKEQFKSALERFTAVMNFDGGELADKYEQLSDEYENSEESAAQVRSRIAAIEDVADALFEEWQDELEQYSSARLKSDSKRKLRHTRQRYQQLLGAMQRAERRMQPVLAAFKDQVLYLKHNLNAKAILSLQEEFGSIKADIQTLIDEMEKSIREADAFIQEIDQQGS